MTKRITAGQTMVVWHDIYEDPPTSAEADLDLIVGAEDLSLDEGADRRCVMSASYDYKERKFYNEFAEFYLDKDGKYHGEPETEFEDWVLAVWCVMPYPDLVEVDNE